MSDIAYCSCNFQIALESIRLPIPISYHFFVIAIKGIALIIMSYFFR